jgi:hypothetical protein
MVAPNRFSVGWLHHRLKHLEKQRWSLAALEGAEHLNSPLPKVGIFMN